MKDIHFKDSLKSILKISYSNISLCHKKEIFLLHEQKHSYFLTKICHRKWLDNKVLFFRLKFKCVADPQKIRLSKEKVFIMSNYKKKPSFVIWLLT